MMKESIRNWLTEQFGADEDLFAELYTQYAADMKSRASGLSALVASGDVAALGEAGHALKGMALQMGDNDLAESCLQLQNAGRAGDLPSCVALVRKIGVAAAAL